MAENSKIEWTDHTFNPWHGCVKVSEGCKNCYAEARQFGGDWWGTDKPRRFFGEKHWNQPIKWNAEAEKLGVRYKVFCGSYCDVFEEREDLRRARNRLGELIKMTPNLDWLLLTKRAEYLISGLYQMGFRPPNPRSYNDIDLPDNVWVGVSIENQAQANIRIPELLTIPAKVRFLSCEPLLEDIDFNFNLCIECAGTGETGGHYFQPDGTDVCGSCGGACEDDSNWVDWVIVGGESGPNARPMNPDWARSIRDQCQEADVKFFMKQMNKIDPIPDDLFIRQFPEVA